MIQKNHIKNEKEFNIKNFKIYQKKIQSILQTNYYRIHIVRNYQKIQISNYKCNQEALEKVKNQNNKEK